MEFWANIANFPGYQVSTEGRVRSFWHRPNYGRGARRFIGTEPRVMPLSDDGQGYLKVCLMRNGKNYIPKVHRLVAEAFLDPPPNDGTEWTVDHIRSGPEGKLDNSVRNLRWLSRGDNIRKAWNDGMCEVRRIAAMRPVMSENIHSGYTIYFPGIGIAASCLGFTRDQVRYCCNANDNDRDGILHVCNGECGKWAFYWASYEDKMLFGGDEWELNGGLAFYDGFRHGY